jgi:hypothetical protein
MAFDRSKYKKSKSLQEQQKELLESGQIKQGSSQSVDYLDFKKDGEYLLKFWPSHLDEQGNPLSYFMMLRKQHFMKVMKDKREDGKIVKDANGNPEQTLGLGAILSSKVHGGTGKDIIDEYIQFVKQLGMDMYPDDKEGYKGYMKNVYGYGSGKNFVGGITANEEYVAYASLINKDTLAEEGFYKVILKASMRKAMLKISSSEDGGEGITTDPFTDPDDGFIVKIKRDSAAAKAANDPSLYYSVTFHTKNYVPVKWPLPDEGFERFEKTPSLHSMLSGVYSAKDFNRALDGLERFDKEHGYNVFGHDKWLDICEEIAAYYPEDDEEDETEAPAPKAAPAKVATPKPKPAPVEEPVAEEEDETPEEEAGDLPWEKDEAEEAEPVAEAAAPAAMSPADKLKAMKAAAAKRKK